jgi:hypothetical protein
MNKEEFLRDIEKALGKIPEAESAEILYDYEEHFMVGKENGKTEEEICLELGNPTDIANNYLLNHTSENIEMAAKEEINNNSSGSGYNTRNMFLGLAITAVILLCIFVSAAVVAKHNKSEVDAKKDVIVVGGIRIDTSGIHGDGISIDSNGVKVPGVKIDDNGVEAPGINIDNNGVRVPGVTIDSNGVKAPGVTIDDNGVKVDLPNVNIDIGN